MTNLPMDHHNRCRFRINPCYAILVVGFLGNFPTVLSAQNTTATSPDEKVVATFNGGQVTEAEVRKSLAQYEIPEESRELAYEEVVTALINQKLLGKFLDDEGIEVSFQVIDDEVKRITEELESTGQGSLASMLAASNLTLTELKEQLELRLRWSQYQQAQSDDASLRDFFRVNLELFTGARVKLSHIFVPLDPETATDAQRTSARKKLLAIKQKIETDEVDFGTAADFYSEDPANVETPAGGNLGYISRRGQVPDEIAEVAFNIAVGEVSDPVTSDFGLHLITITDRSTGQDITYDDVLETVKAQFGQDLQQSIVEDLRAKANIKIRPMDPDLFVSEVSPIVTGP